ncbi:MAG TPA: iron-containing alcohol dehydrogenase [Bryobacteraceae bacterium]|jgi:alcohol dehydrogenase class IV|nr:iron-containing alcohol dehydrogenase [Bryobacteraceae bacterium]
MRFEFATATRILFGPGMVREVPAATAAMGTRALVVTGASPDRAAPIIASLKACAFPCLPFSVAGEPSVALVRSGAEYARREGCDLVIAIGGGSAIDAGKALAAMLTNPGDPLDYLEVIGRGQPLERASAPFIAIPTTAGTGSEVTRNAVLASPEQRVKASLRSASMLPRLAVIDPELTLELPRAITASTGLDALTQLIEPYVSVRANPMTDLFCAEGIRQAAAALPQAWEDGHNREARGAMAWASLLGGLALANAGLGVVHGFAAPVGGMFCAPHGAICAAVLPHAMEGNIQALSARAPESQAVERYDQVARLLTGSAQATAPDGVRWIAELCRKLEIPPLSTYGVSAGDIPELAEKAAKASSMKGNPIPLTPGELGEILERAI